MIMCILYIVSYTVHEMYTRIHFVYRVLTHVLIYFAVWNYDGKVIFSEVCLVIKIAQ